MCRRGLVPGQCIKYNCRGGGIKYICKGVRGGARSGMLEADSQADKALA